MEPLSVQYNKAITASLSWQDTQPALSFTRNDLRVLLEFWCFLNFLLSFTLSEMLPKSKNEVHPQEMTVQVQYNKQFLILKKLSVCLFQFYFLSNIDYY